MSLKISRILHAGYLFDSGDTKIAFDPIFENPFSRNCYAFPDVKFDQQQIRNLKLSAVFISHFHDDHCSLDSLDLLNKSTPIYLYCVFPQMAEMIQRLGFSHVFNLELNKPINIGPFEITPRQALDNEVDSIFHVQIEGLNILNVVDSWIDPETMDILAQTKNWDMILWPFQTMRELEVLSPLRAEPFTRELPQEWREQLQTLKPRYLVPSSCQFIHEDWSWYNHALFPVSYQNFLEQLQYLLPETQVVRLNPSSAVALDQKSISQASALSWIQPLGDQNVDYKYLSDIKPPSTANISKQFPQLSDVQTDQVLQYCRKNLIDKYNSMDSSQEPYFHKTRIWKLSLYDADGESTDFFYCIKNKEMQILSECLESPSWFTEISFFKLHSALHSGESLTSLYLRVNDMTFSNEIEEEIRTADVIEDPLIRCLFNEAFGAYQREQLERLRP